MPMKLVAHYLRHLRRASSPAAPRRAVAPLARRRRPPRRAQTRDGWSIATDDCWRASSPWFASSLLGATSIVPVPVRPKRSGRYMPRRRLDGRT